jgi:hypothetical protein
MLDDEIPLYDIPPEVEAEYWKLVDRSDPDGCWPWLGVITSHGGACFPIRVKGLTSRVQANRIAHQLRHKQSVARVYSCPVLKHCVNPDHLRSMSIAEPITDPEELARIERVRSELQSWMSKHRNKTRRGVKSVKELQNLSR